MVAPSLTPTAFGEDNFGAAQLGDPRRTRRLVRVAEQILQHPAGTLPEKLQSPGQLKALYRLVGRPEVTHDAVLQPAAACTQQRLLDYPGVVLRLADQTVLDYSSKKSLKHLGKIGNGRGRGYLCHTTLAVAADDRRVLGVADQLLHRPQPARARESKDASRKRRTRTSRLWRQAAERLGPAPAGRRWIEIADRGADVTEYLDYMHHHDRRYVVRSAHNRRILLPADGGPPQKLHDYARTLADWGRQTVEVPARPGQSARTATVRVAAAAVRVVPPRQPRGDHGQEPLAAWVVHVREVAPPPGVKPLEWILLTNEPVTTVAEAQERVAWYSCRPVIEDFHKGLKTGCAVERLQFTAEEHLEPVIALLSVVAAFLVGLRDLGRQEATKKQPATTAVPALWVEVLSVWRYREVRPALTLEEFCQALARLGGHQNRPSDGPPGWLTLWRGWTKLHIKIESVTAMCHLKSGRT